MSPLVTKLINNSIAGLADSPSGPVEVTPVELMLLVRNVVAECIDYILITDFSDIDKSNEAMDIVADALTEMFY